MLLRSSSTPILNSWLPINSSSSSSTPDHHPPKSIHLITSKSASLCSCDTSSTPPVTGLVRASSDPDLRLLTFGSVSGSGGLISSGSMLLTNSGLGLTESVVVEEEEEYGGGSVGGGGGGGSGNDYNNGNDNDTDGYYMRMIKANPGNSLILGNYAKFLKEVRGDYVKAEEYCGRAILANPGDPSVLALYADLIWQSQRDSSRAESYFDQAVKASPDDCYVLGSYAHFLWDAEDEDEEEESEKTVSSNTVAPMAYHGVSVAS